MRDLIAIVVNGKVEMVTKLTQARAERDLDFGDKTRPPSLTTGPKNAKLGT